MKAENASSKGSVQTKKNRSCDEVPWTKAGEATKVYWTHSVIFTLGGSQATDHATLPGAGHGPDTRANAR